MAVMARANHTTDTTPRSVHCRLSLTLQTRPL